MKTLEQLWNETFYIYELTFDNLGNFKIGKGIVPNEVAKQSEEIMKDYVTKRRKRDIQCKVLWNRKEHCVSRITIKR